MPSRPLPPARPQARKLEGELDVKIAAYGKLCNGYEYSYTKGESGLAGWLAACLGCSVAACSSHRSAPLHLQLLAAKSSEIEKLLARLSDVNDGMRSALAGTADGRSHTLARHRDILHDFTQAGRGGGAALLQKAPRERANRAQLA